MRTAAESSCARACIACRGERPCSARPAIPSRSNTFPKASWIRGELSDTARGPPRAARPARLRGIEHLEVRARHQAHVQLAPHEIAPAHAAIVEGGRRPVRILARTKQRDRTRILADLVPVAGVAVRGQHLAHARRQQLGDLALVVVPFRAAEAASYVLEALLQVGSSLRGRQADDVRDVGGEPLRQRKARWVARRRRVEQAHEGRRRPEAMELEAHLVEAMSPPSE